MISETDKIVFITIYFIQLAIWFFYNMNLKNE